MHRSEGATALLGMDEFVVGAQAEVDGEVWLAVETVTDVVGCDACGTRAVGHGRRPTRRWGQRQIRLLQDTVAQAAWGRRR